jgi:DNA-binding transcriptional LysR family regulator
MSFQLTSHECEVLLVFEKAHGLSELAKNLGRDISVVSRILKSISEKSDVLEKNKGRWRLTERGKKLNRWTEDAILGQQVLLGGQKHLKIATTREFATLILMPQARALIGDEDITLSIFTSDDGIEEMILSGEADFGFDCGRPFDPAVAFKRVARESFVCVASPTFLKKTGAKNYKEVQTSDHLKFVRGHNFHSDIDSGMSRHYGSFNDIATIREACKLGYGWAILPYYTVAQEITRKELRVLPGLKQDDEQFGVWWSRERKSLGPWVKKAALWLSKQEIKLKQSGIDA